MNFSSTHRQRGLAIVVLMLVFCTAHATSYCARGVGATFTRTVKLDVHIAAMPAGPNSDRLSAYLLKRFWKGRASQVYLEPFDYDACVWTLDKPIRIAASMTPDELAAFDQAMAEHGEVEKSLPKSFQYSAELEGYKGADGPKVIGFPYSRIEIHFATDRVDRGESSSPISRFGYERSRSITYGRAIVTIPVDHCMGEMESGAIMGLEFFSDRTNHITVQELQSDPLSEWKESIRYHSTRLGRPGVLLFIHGYNVGFNAAAIRSAQLAYDLGFPGATALFSWASRDGPVQYVADMQAAEWSIPNLRQVIVELSEASGGPVYILAHSMGNQVLLKALQDSISRAPLPGKLREVILAAPDVDFDVFDRDIAPAILGHGPRVTLYASKTDRALALSKSIRSNYRRLGDSNPSVFVAKNLDSIDASLVKTDLVGHSYYGDSTTVISDLSKLIRENLGPSDRRGLELVAQRGYWRFKPPNPRAKKSCARAPDKLGDYVERTPRAGESIYPNY